MAHAWMASRRGTFDKKTAKPKTNTADEQIGGGIKRYKSTHHSGDVDGLGVGHGNRRISVHEQHRHRNAYDVGTPEDDGSLARDLDPVPIQELDAALPVRAAARRCAYRGTQEQ